MNKKNIKKYFNSLFWNSYAKSYDDITKYYKPYRVLISEIVKSFVKIKGKGNVLDAGCGTGELAIQLLNKGYNVWGVDISDAMLRVFKDKISSKRIKKISVKKGDLNRRLSYNSRKFDIVINVHSLFMLDNIWFSLNELTRVLKNNGILIIAHHKPVNIYKLFCRTAVEEGVLYTLKASLRHLKAGLLNILLGHVHRKYYENIPVESIIKYLKNKQMKLILKSKLYRGYDTLLIFKNRRR